MSSFLPKFMAPFEPSRSPPSTKPSSTNSRRVHFVEDAEPPSSTRAKLCASKRKSRYPPLLSAFRSLSEHFKCMLQTGDHSEEPVNGSFTDTALVSIRPRLTRLFIGSLKTSPSTNNADVTRECLFSPNSVVTANEPGTTTLVSDRSQEEQNSIDYDAEPCYGPLPKGRPEAIMTWVEKSLEGYAEAQESEYPCWVHSQRVVEWRRYRSRRRIAKSRSGDSETHEILVVKLIGRSEESTFLKFERYMRDRSIDCAKGGNYRPLIWQRWYPDDRVTMLDEWPDKRRYVRCEGQVFYQKEHQLSFMDLLITVHLAVVAPWTDFWTRNDHWFAVLLGRTLNGKMEETRRLRGPVACSVVEKYGKTWRWDCFRVSTRHERRKIVELIHLCGVASHREKVRLFNDNQSKAEEPNPGGRIPEGTPKAEERKDSIRKKTASK